jgi:hypothetical protein
MGPRAAVKKRRDFAPHAFLATTGEGHHVHSPSGRLLWPSNAPSLLIPALC